MYIERFIKEEEGLETIEFLGIVLVAVGLAAVIAAVATKIAGKTSGQASKVDNISYDYGKFE